MIISVDKFDIKMNELIRSDKTCQGHILKPNSY